MALNIVRVLFLLACAATGAVWGVYLVSEEDPSPDWNPVPAGAIGGLAGAAVAGLLIAGLQFISQELFERITPVLVVIVLFMTLGYGLAQYLLLWMPGLDNNIKLFVITSFVVVFGFVGILLGLTLATSFSTIVRESRRRPPAYGNAKLVDTSVIIDGRLADICETGFIEGTMLLPRFVLQELQHIADSADDLRRARGRRGLDILRRLQSHETPTQVEVIEDDPFEVGDVDSKLVALARVYNAKVITNDLNLNKVAQIEGVTVLNINDLANALKPALLPDEHMAVHIVKEGKEASQGVGYLDDGTMVVVDGGKSHVGEDVSVVVTSVLQTTAGRMIFTRLENVTA
jgi:uncharacterized protein YacL